MNYALILNPSLIRPLMLKWKFSLRTFCLMSFAFMVALVGLYIFQIIAVTRASFLLADYDKQVLNSNKELQNLQISFSGSSSLSSLETLLVSKGYEKVGKIQYIQLLENTVAAK